MPITPMPLPPDAPMMRAVAVFHAVVGVVVAVHEVPAAPVVDEAVAIVVDAVHGIVGIHPHVAFQIGVLRHHAPIDDAHVDLPAACVATRPGLGGAGAVHVLVQRCIGTVDAPGITGGVVFVEQQSIDGRLDAVVPIDHVSLHECHAGLRLQMAQRCIHIDAGFGAREVQVTLPVAAPALCEQQLFGAHAGTGQKGCLLSRTDGGRELNEQLVGGVARQVLARRHRLRRAARRQHRAQQQADENSDSCMQHPSPHP
jgi:hypothetical protein